MFCALNSRGSDSARDNAERCNRLYTGFTFTGDHMNELAGLYDTLWILRTGSRSAVPAPQGHPHPQLPHPHNEQKEELPLSENHRQVSKEHTPHALHEEHAAGPHDPKIINPKLASDVAYWSKEFGVTGDALHEAIRAHGTHVDKVRAALHPTKTA